MNLEASIYQALLKLYPRAFRERYSEEMTRVFQESLSSQGSSFKLWIQTFADVFSSASREHVQGGRMSLLNKLAGISSVLIGVWQVVFLFRILQDSSDVGATTIEAIFHSIFFLAVFAALIARPVQQRGRIWWLTIASLVVLLPLTMVGFWGPRLLVLDWVLQNTSIIVFACTCLNFVRIEKRKLSFLPEFWGLAVLVLTTVIQRIFVGPIVLHRDHSAGQWELMISTVAFVSGWLALGFALWSRASNPQPRALT
jgi:hypothetical protein